MEKRLKLSPVQEVRKGQLEWFICSCGCDKFHITNEYLDGSEPQLGVVEMYFDCVCGKTYSWNYGIIDPISKEEVDEIVKKALEHYLKWHLRAARL